MTAIRALAVYCGSATPPDPRFIDLASQVGTYLAQQNIAVVYGGGRLGLMGAVADAALAAGGTVIGVIPEAMVDREAAHRGLSELRIVSDMHERKRAFTDLADGFVTLPGGVGTMDELWEAISWAQLGYHAKPVGLLNAFGYYDELIAFNQRMADSGFVRKAHRGILIVAQDIAELTRKLISYEPHQAIFQMPVGAL